MILTELSYYYDFIPVPSSSSVFVYIRAESPTAFIFTTSRSHQAYVAVTGVMGHGLNDSPGYDACPKSHVGASHTIYVDSVYKSCIY